MELLEQRIAREGKTIGSDIVKVDMFLNHQIDTALLNEMGKEFYRIFKNDNITKILTIEASGIGIACMTAQYFSAPVLFAKKDVHKNVGTSLYSADVHSFTKGVTTTIGVSKDYLSSDDNILIIDDFLANGQAVEGLISITEQAGATLKGVGIAIEKGFQSGGEKIRCKGIKLASLAVIDSINNGNITFRNQPLE